MQAAGKEEHVPPGRKQDCLYRWQIAEKEVQGSYSQLMIAPINFLTARLPEK
jgi:hypothetical protein